MSFRHPGIRLSYLSGALSVLLLITSASVDFLVSSSLAGEGSQDATVKSVDSGLADSDFVEAEHLRSEQSKDANLKAIAKYKEASELWRNDKQYEKAAKALRNAGELSQLLGDTQNALLQYNQSLAISQRAKSLLEEGRVRNDLGYLQFIAGSADESQRNCLIALKIGESIDDRALIAQARSNIGETYYSLGTLSKAVEYQEQALSVWRELGDARGQSQALVALGYYNANLAEPMKAVELFDQALEFSRGIRDLHGEAQALIAKSFLKVKVAEPQEALDALIQARPLVERIGDRTSLAIIVGQIGSIYFGLGDKEKALDFCSQGTKLFELGNEKWGAAEGRLALGRIHHLFGEEQLALKYLNEAAELFRSLSMPRLEAQTFRYLGLVYSALNDNKKALEAYERSLKLLKPGQDQQQESYSLNYIGSTYENLNDYKTALDYYQRALPLSRVASDQVAEILTLHNLAHAERARGNLEAASERIEESIDLSESLRGRVTNQDLRASYFATVRQNYELYIDILMLLHKRQPSEGLDAKAFDVSERARARTLLEVLQESQANIREGVNPSLLAQEKALNDALNLKAERQMKLLAQNDKSEAEKVGQEINSLATEYAGVRDQIKTTSPRYAALTLPQPLKVSEVQKRLLDDNSVLLEYALGDDRSYVWVVTHTGLTTYELPSRKEIEDSARSLYSKIVAHQMVQGESVQQFSERKEKATQSMGADTAQLSKLVLGPLAGQLGNKRLLIVSDGALQYIPFALLDDPDSDKNSPQPLVRTHEIVNEPSASTLAVLLQEAKQRKDASNSVAILADPVFEVDDPRVTNPSHESTPESAESVRVKQALRDVGISANGVQIPRLLASSEEAEAIMDSAPWGTGLKAVGFAANRQRVLGPELADYRVVHFATHGMINNEHPELSGIVLSLFDQDGRSQDGFLRLHDIYNLHIPADLVVLSACSTGLGKDVRGEGLISLTRGFMYAGASGVVASLWKVDDQATAQLMKLFYEGMFQKGLTPVAALRQAQLAMSKQKPWQSPYYWAGFVIQGRYDEQVKGSQFSYHTPKRIAVFVVLLVTFILATALIIRRRRRRII
jgi:CHAT domain-containing protein